MSSAKWRLFCLGLNELENKYTTYIQRSATFHVFIFSLVYDIGSFCDFH